MPMAAMHRELALQIKADWKANGRIVRRLREALQIALLLEFFSRPAHGILFRCCLLRFVMHRRQFVRDCDLHSNESPAMEKSQATISAISRVETEGEVVVGPEQEHSQASDRHEQSERRPIPCAEAVRQRARAEERACERGSEDQRRGSSMQTLDGGLLLKQASESFLIDEGRATVIRVFDFDSSVMALLTV
jgi:hypothetical protein